MNLVVVQEDGKEVIYEEKLVADEVLESVQMSAPAFDEGEEVEAVNENEVCAKVKIGGINGIPEFKTTTCMTRIGPIKTKIPCVMTRTSNKVLYATLCYPKLHEADLAKKARDCALVAAGTATIAAFIATPASALPAFKGAFMACLRAKAEKLASQVKVGLHTESEHGSWKRRV